MVGKIIRLIRFCELKYLQVRVKEFGKLVPSIIVTTAAIVRGVCEYGLKPSTIVDLARDTKVGVDKEFHEVALPVKASMSINQMPNFMTKPENGTCC
ncbi:hypothetical protein GLOIN_2v1834672 [Rhizophagus clarus]|uniref:Uncharacterized protein n=1 Tax=Rhizophagus clarus TaxID=94130 RepID=A0A8H3L8W6_9GLOM|nr:hypothetical protein GLOIN_2v1834672 [Rhizophagus clarus]